MGDDTLGARVRQLRLARRMTVAELAERVGVSRPTIWAWEHGKSQPRERRILPLAESLNVPEDELILGRIDPEEVDDNAPLQDEIAHSNEHPQGAQDT